MITLEQIIDTLEIHFMRIDAVLPEIKTYLPFEIDSFDNTDIIKTIDSFAFCFSKIQDTMGDKFFPAILFKLEDYKDNMSTIDILNKLEKLELLYKDDWLNYRQLRNDLTHEYPDNRHKIAQAINESVAAYNEDHCIRYEC